MPATMRYIKYVCTKCKAEDFDKLFPEEPVQPAINCWNCHAGRKKEMDEMLTTGVGMFPAGEVDADHRPIAAA